MIFLNKFNLNFRKKFAYKFDKKFISKFILRFNKFFIKIFSEAFTKKRSNYLYLERYIEKTIGNFDIDRQTFIKSFNKKISFNLMSMFIKKFNKQFIKFFKIKLKTKNQSVIKNEKKILLISFYKRKLYFFYNKLYNLYFYWYIYMNNNYLFYINNCYFTIWLSFFFWTNRINFYFLQLYFKNINYLNMVNFNIFSDHNIYKWFFIQEQNLYKIIGKFSIKKISFDWFFISKKIYIYRSYFSIFDDIKRSYRLRKRKKNKKVPLLLPFYFYKNKGFYYKDGKRHHTPWKKGKTISLIF